MAKNKFDIMSVMNPQSMPEEPSAGAFVIEMIPLESIEPNEENFYDTAEVEPLANDILQNGLMHNIKVWRRGEDGKYKIISGERRYRAFVMLKGQGREGYDAIPATVDDEENPLLVKLKLISANATARVLTDYEKAEQAAQIESIVKQLKQQGVELPGRAREIAAQVLGVSTAQVGRLEKISRDLVPEVKEQFKAGDIGVTKAYEVSTLPAEQQPKAAEKAKEPVAVAKEPKQEGQKQKELPIQNEGKQQEDNHANWAVAYPWVEGFDDELLKAAICLEQWNGLHPHKPEFLLLKSLMLQEAAMRKKRTK